MIQVHFFAGLREQAKVSQIDWRWEKGLSAGQLRSQLTQRWPTIDVLLQRSTLAVNNQIVPDSFLIPDQAEVALLPPVSGG
ncbi:MAG: MoaD/ThiS family protein [Planctomycetia bacterium]|nr:MoaD/ThiS family protein [Planctomycetia bacterium]